MKAYVVALQLEMSRWGATEMEKVAVLPHVEILISTNLKKPAIFLSFTATHYRQ